MKLNINTRLTEFGFDVFINRKRNSVKYPPEVWSTFPDSLKIHFAQLITFITTVHLCFNNKKFINYQFPTPPGASCFMYGLFQSMPENLTDFLRSKLKSSDYFRIINNSFYNFAFNGHISTSFNSSKGFLPKKNTALVPFSLGKDSLLTYALCKKLGIRPIPVFMIEPSNEFENEQKYKLIKKFQDEFNEKIYTFTVPLSHLKQTKGLWWGWDNFLTQYTFFLLPFIYHFRPEYFFWSNEQECNETVQDGENFTLNQTFDQSASWMQMLNSGLMSYGGNIKLASLIEPLTRFMIFYLLHFNFPKYGKYQTSCLAESSSAKTNRWCGQCHECASVYLYLIALGINPGSVGFRENMIAKRKLPFFPLLQKGKELYWGNKFIFRKKELLLAYYLVYSKGLKSSVLEKYKKEYFPKSKKDVQKLKKAYSSLYSAKSVPEELNHTLNIYYRSQIIKLRKLLG